MEQRDGEMTARQREEAVRDRQCMYKGLLSIGNLSFRGRAFTAWLLLVVCYMTVPLPLSFNHIKCSRGCP